MNKSENLYKDHAQYREVFDFVQDFFYTYYTLRDPEKVMAVCDEKVLCFCLGADEVARNREAFGGFVRRQMQNISQPIPYQLVDYEQVPCGSCCWNCIARLEITVQIPDYSKVCYDIRFSAHVHKENGLWLFDLLHVSESAVMQDNLRLPVLEALPRVSSDPERVQQELGRIVSQMVPGGIIVCLTGDGYPLSLANDQCLRMLGYSGYQSFAADVDGLFLNGIHPDDRKKCVFNVQFALNTGKQCECEYRLRRQDGSYLWVHDATRTTLGEDGQTLLVSNLIDISDQIACRVKLEMETETDTLTGIYNRRGASRIIESSRDEEASQWLFFIADLDNFKRVNDIYGHKQGDKILCYIAGELDRHFSRYGTVYRLGGDEFALYLNHCPDFATVQKLLKTVSDNYADMLEETCPDAHSTLSLGGVYGEEPADIDLMYEKADKNLYKIKYSDKGNLSFSHIDSVD